MCSTDGCHRRAAKKRKICHSCRMTNYMNGKGTGSTGYHIDRIDERKGYFKNNIQVLSNRENVKKYIQFDYEERQRGLGSGFRYLKRTEPDYDKTGTDDHPF